jgi:TonB family protein
MMPVPWMLWEGQVVDLAFPLRRYLGGTDHSAVYLTQYGDLEPRNAAIKLVPAAAPEGDLASQWERAAKLSHPRLLRMFRTGSCQMNQMAVSYAVTEYAEENLAQVLTERALTPAEVRQILGPLLEALQYLQKEGLVHGHLKPANILAVNDELKLSVDGVSAVGEPGAAPGRPGPYDPPEFAERGPSPIGDVWSLGVTLVEALTQQLPTQSGPKQDPILPETLPAEFLPMVCACLQPDPRRRATLDQVLSQFQGTTPKAEEERGEPPFLGARKWLSVALVSAAAVVLAAIFLVPPILHRPAASAPAEQHAAVQPASPPVSAAAEPVHAADPVQAEAPKPAVVTPAPARAPRGPAKHIAAAPGQVIHQVVPDVPEYARRTIRGTVKVDVLATVDAAGHVSDATVESQGSKYFAKLALAAARQWSFEAVPGAWRLRFEFTTAGATVHPSRVVQQ